MRAKGVESRRWIQFVDRMHRRPAASALQPGFSFGEDNALAHVAQGDGPGPVTRATITHHGRER